MPTGANTFRLPVGRGKTIERIVFGVGSTHHNKIYARIVIDQLKNNGRGLGMVLAYGYASSYPSFSKDVVWEGNVHLPDESEWAVYILALNRTGIENGYNITVHYGDDA